MMRGSRPEAWDFLHRARRHFDRLRASRIVKKRRLPMADVAQAFAVEKGRAAPPPSYCPHDGKELSRVERVHSVKVFSSLQR